ncbi:MAG TPA: ABC transporter permease [Humidesulfovibrio sp.]|uniref:ABC transporter permease n=1 Tax=Humidesulfovibrio sp. TaxID=2910988 RepID=UPI002CDCFB60|nr:ABC transporter permease [Humidesulfovibrio sp.]HWR03812.1 ABC transporter permease [Humidesulfovibrio sp.]
MTGLRVIFEPRHASGAGRAAFSVLCAFAAAGIFGSLAFALAGVAPAEAWMAMAQGALGSPYSVSEILLKAAPLTLTGLAVALCCRLNLWNIGAEGQFVSGAVCACWAALFAPAWWPVQFALPLALAAGMAGGAAWALAPALLKARLGVSEILSTLLLNYVAVLFMEHLYFGPWRDPEGMGFPGTAELPEAVWLPALPHLPEQWGTRVHWGLPLALVLAVGLWWLLGRTRWGFRARVLGESPKAAAYAGFRAGRITVAAMCLSGALAGLAGAGELLGVQHRLQDGLSTGLGFAGIIVAFLARLNVLAVPLAALLLGGLLVGADQLQTELRLPGSTILALEAALLFGALLGEFLAGRRLRLKRAPVDPTGPEHDVTAREKPGEGGHAA